jgi:TonB family protein
MARVCRRLGLLAGAAAIAFLGAMPGEAHPAAAPAPEAPDATTVSPLTVRGARLNGPPDATVEVPSDNDAKGRWASAWPETAFRNGVGGRVLLTCGIDRYGLAVWCKVLSETPAGQGFGPAALAMRPTFKLKPAIDPEGSALAVMTVEVEFKPPKPTADWGGKAGGGLIGASTGPLSAGGGADTPRFSGPGPANRSVVLLENPIWSRTVGYDEMRSAYPARAGGASGYAVAHCEVHPGGGLSDCQVIKEDPDDRGFARAALSLAPRFRVAPMWSRAPGHADLWVDIPFRFPPPGAADPRTVSAPVWLSGFDPDQALKVFPKEAADRGLSTGYGVAECQVAKDGGLSGCAPGRADPEGLGFSEAAVELASSLRMNPWQRDGEPVDGASVRVGIRLNLKPGG